MLIAGGDVIAASEEASKGFDAAPCALECGMLGHAP
jgi:hypothetical protein